MFNSTNISANGKVRFNNINCGLKSTIYYKKIILINFLVDSNV